MNVFDLINEDDLFALACLIAILYIVGANMADAKVRVWGWRAAAVAYVAFVVYACARIDPTSASDLARIAFRGLFAAGLTVGPTWMVLAIALFFINELPSVERRIVVQPTAPPPEPTRVDRERERQEREERERRQASDLAACEELRLECELLYDRHAEQLRAALPPERIAALLDSYLSGQTDPQLVANRTGMIKRMLADQLSAQEVPDGEAFKSLQELAEYFAALRNETHDLPYEEDTRDSILTALNKQEDEAIEAFFKKGAR